MKAKYLSKVLLRRTIVIIMIMVSFMLIITSAIFFQSSKQNYLEQNQRLLNVMNEQAHHFLMHPEQELKLVEATLSKNLEYDVTESGVLFILQRFSYIYRLEHIDTNGIIVSTYPEEKNVHGLDYSRNPVFTNAQNIKPYDFVLGGTFIDPVVGSPSMSITMKARDGSYIVGYLDLTQLENAFENAQTKGMTYAIVDENGHYLAYPKSELVLQRKVDPYFNDIKKGQIESGSIVKHDQEKNIIQYKEISSTGWYLIIYQDIDKMLAPILFSIIVLTFIFGLIAIISSYSINSVLSRMENTLRGFIELTKNVSAGNYKNKATQYDYIEFQELSSNFQQMTSELEQREEKIGHLNDALENSYLKTVFLLARTIEAKDSYTGDHCERVKNFALQIGRKIGLSKDELRDLEKGSLLHDIGKIKVSEAVLLKAGPLSDEEYHQIKLHSVYGYDLISEIPDIDRAKEVILYHHERMDGKGYPVGLKGNDIPLLARIVCIADAFDAMTSARIYREEPFVIEKAIVELEDNKDKQFDGFLVDKFIECIRENGIN